MRIVARVPAGVVREPFRATGPTSGRTASAPPKADSIQVPTPLSDDVLGADWHILKSRGGRMGLLNSRAFPAALIEFDFSSTSSQIDFAEYLFRLCNRNQRAVGNSSSAAEFLYSAEGVAFAGAMKS